MANYVPVFLSKTLSGWPAGTPRYYVYQTGECDSAAALISAMSDPQRLAATVASLPAAASGKHWAPRACSAAAVVSSVSCVESNGHTLMTVASTGACEINITATGGGAVWGDATTWYPVTLNSSGQYVKDWTFYFEPGTYHIQARPSGSANSATYKSTDFTAVAKTGGGTVTPPPTGDSSDADLDAFLGAARTLTGASIPGASSSPGRIALTSQVVNGRVYVYNSINFTPPDNYMRGVQIDGRFYNSYSDYPGGELGRRITVTEFVVPTGTPKDQWTTSTHPSYPGVQAYITTK